MGTRKGRRQREEEKESHAQPGAGRSRLLPTVLRPRVRLAQINVLAVPVACAQLVRYGFLVLLGVLP